MQHTQYPYHFFTVRQGIPGTGTGYVVTDSTGQTLALHLFPFSFSSPFPLLSPFPLPLPVLLPFGALTTGMHCASHRRPVRVRGAGDIFDQQWLQPGVSGQRGRLSLALGRL